MARVPAARTRQNKDKAASYIGAGIVSPGGLTPQILLGGSSLAESAAIGSTVGALTVQNGSGTWTFTKTADPDGKFAVSGSNLVTAAGLDFETKTSHDVTVQATNGITTITRTFTVGVTNVLEGTLAPTTAAFTAGAAVGSTVATVSGLDVGANEALASVADGRFVAASGNRIVIASDAIAAGTINTTYTTTAGRTQNIAITVNAAAAKLVYPTMFVAGASLEEFGVGGDNLNRFGFAPQGHLPWVNALGGTRLFDINLAHVPGNADYVDGPTVYATSGAGWSTLSATGAGRQPIGDQVDAIIAAADAAGLPPEKRLVYYTLGRNDLGSVSASTYMSNFITGWNKLKAANFTIVTPELWNRSTSAANWGAGSQARTDILTVNSGMASFIAGEPAKHTCVPLMDTMCDATGDRNPKAGYVQSDGTHMTPIGAKAGAAVIRAALLAKIEERQFPSGYGLARTFDSTGGTLVSATGPVPDGYTLRRNDTAVTVVGSKPSADVYRVDLTRAVTQAAAWNGFQFEGAAAGAGKSIPVEVGKKYRARWKVTIQPTPVPLTVGAYFQEFASDADTTVLQRVYALWKSTPAAGGLAQAPNNGTGENVDASNGLTLYLETPDIVLKSTTGSPVLRPCFNLAANQGGTETITTLIERVNVAAL